MLTISQTAVFVKGCMSGLTDKSGGSLYHHALRVQNNLDLIAGRSTYNEYVIALLHDVVEDTDVTFEDLRTLEYPEAVIERLKLLTKEDMFYTQYIDRIIASGDRSVIKVKIADQMDNLDPVRWVGLSDEFKSHLEQRYAGVLPRLQAALNETMEKQNGIS